MTATATATAPATGGAPAPATGRTRRPRSARYVVPAEICLGLLTLATIVGFSRVFSDWSFLPPLAVVAVFSHLVMAVCRRRGWGVPLTALVGGLGFLLLLTYTFFAGTTRVGIPGPDTLQAVRNSLSAAWQTFQSVVAPAPPETGFLLAASLAVFFAVFLADWAAFRLWSPFEAIVPATTLFIFCSLLGSQVHRLDATAVFAVAAAAFLLVHRIAKRELSSTWLSADVARGSDALLRTGALLGAVALLGGLVIGPRLPGAESNGLISWRGSEAGKGDRFTISPLVEIRSRLVDQPDTELFTVDSPVKAYWRMTSLDTFDGNSWRSRGRFTVADGDLEGLAPAAPSTGVDQRFTITGLARLWIPAAFRPVWVSPEARARYQAESSTLIVDTGLDNSDGLNYAVRSDIPSFSPDDLRGSDATAVPADVSSKYLELPGDFPGRARSTATDVVRRAGAQTSYDKARALQDWFQQNFRYNQNVPAGHGDSAINDFLDKREGYCEQFAGTFAAMARSLGMPARVAVGFTWGDEDPTRKDHFVVKGEHAHAWPEVYLGQYGWVAFEPTPGRGAPGAEGWTGRPPQQAQGRGGTTTSAPATSTTAVGAGSSSVPTTAPATLPPRALGDVTVGDEPTGVSTAFVVAMIVAFGLLLLAGLYLIGIPAAHRWRRRHRRQAAHDPDTQVRVAWEETLEDLSLVGSVPRSTETHDEFAQRAADRVPDAGTDLVDLAHDTDAATFAPGQLDEDDAARARDRATTISGLVLARVSSRRRWARQLDPRPLIRRRRGTPRHQATSGR